MFYCTIYQRTFVSYYTSTILHLCLIVLTKYIFKKSKFGVLTVCTYNPTIFLCYCYLLAANLSVLLYNLPAYIFVLMYNLRPNLCVSFVQPTCLYPCSDVHPTSLHPRLRTQPTSTYPSRFFL
jgi:hypothetical protein